jgi:hypothetical protein
MTTYTVPAAYYGADLAQFRTQTAESILGSLTARSEFAVEPAQRDAWLSEIALLKATLEMSQGAVFLEFVVPRLGSRIDAVLIIGAAVVVIEFKVGERHVNTNDVNQVWDYALDLKNFHKGSHTASVFPILVATELKHVDVAEPSAASDLVFSPMCCGPAALTDALRFALRTAVGPALDPAAWCRAPYQPTPTIIQAAQSLYANHSVQEIARHDAGATNLAITSLRVEELIESARTARRKSIVFVTGVPGAGKTLVGLNVATQRHDDQTHAVFLSGNGPLVKVLREALVRDEVERSRRKGQRTRKGDVEQKVKAFIQNVHHFRDEGLSQVGPPTDRVVIFDEAQRAWNAPMTADFMRRKKGRPGFTQSEPEFLLSYLDRHQDWAVVICLVGGGQEINRGEAGIAAWLEAVLKSFPSWEVHISPSLTDSEYAAASALDGIVTSGRVLTDKALHLSTSMRSFRAEDVSRAVKALLDREVQLARDLVQRIAGRYPIVLTRSLDTAREWVRSRARGSERFGVVASSSAMRLKARGVDVRLEVDPVKWFLNGPDDTRSSYYLEDAATEFQVQGLEIDWSCVAWDADFRSTASDWSFHSFVGTRWIGVNNSDRRNYLRNAYRVLLTRARQGMVIVVPDGDTRDATRQPGYYDGTFGYLRDVGLEVL